MTFACPIGFARNHALLSSEPIRVKAVAGARAHQLESSVHSWSRICVVTSRKLILFFSLAHSGPFSSFTRSQAETRRKTYMEEGETPQGSSPLLNTYRESPRALVDRGGVIFARKRENRHSENGRAVKKGRMRRMGSDGVSRKSEKFGVPVRFFPFCDECDYDRILAFSFEPFVLSPLPPFFFRAPTPMARIKICPLCSALIFHISFDVSILRNFVLSFVYPTPPQLILYYPLFL